MKLEWHWIFPPYPQACLDAEHACEGKGGVMLMRELYNDLRIEYEALTTKRAKANKFAADCKKIQSYCVSAHLRRLP